VVHRSLTLHLQKDVKLAHMSQIPCPFYLCKRSVYVHSSNGTFVAVDKDGGVYIACTTCQIKEECEGLVKGTLGGRYQWLAIQEDTFKNLQGGT
jgi:hypothetical protein